MKDLKAFPLENYIYFGFSLFNPRSKLINWSQVKGIIILISLVCISFIAILYFGSNVYFAIKQLSDCNTELSSASKAFQTQLFYSLVVQTIISIFLIHLPSTILVINSFLGTAYETYGNLMTITISLFPAIDPLATFVIIKPYREAVIGKFKR
ncbi:Protein CBG04706 [Caenorhabditis briggsae]|uniref:Protein CBG04706 n=1 Tax=Caenorhabditis briggsae TaxID=6238 RepID=A8WYA1_CAEBR|nr:Protein CBG04706 [Caenorhabditis briggsae]CAP25359.2 Protein CBG04706 [Caenorhabditis briggsae]